MLNLTVVITYTSQLSERVHDNQTSTNYQWIGAIATYDICGLQGELN